MIFLSLSIFIMPSTSIKLYLGFLKDVEDEKLFRFVFIFADIVEKLFEGGLEKWVEKLRNFFAVEI